mmetsp:Transcript_3817/g.6048  ORF Transcript_3817/g.6048 Transcript_3817/m.6048 type:complete len:202 (-) Transcript_3817:62-667(-)
MDADMLARQEAERLEELTYYHQDNLNHLFNVYDKNKDSFIDTSEIYSLLEDWGKRAAYWVPVILLKTTIETVSIAKEQAKIQGKPVPASAKRNFGLAKKQIAVFSSNFFRYSNPVVATTTLAQNILKQIIKNYRYHEKQSKRSIDDEIHDGDDNDDKGNKGSDVSTSTTATSTTNGVEADNKSSSSSSSSCRGSRDVVRNG